MDTPNTYVALLPEGLPGQRGGVIRPVWRTGALGSGVFSWVLSAVCILAICTVWAQGQEEDEEEEHTGFTLIQAETDIVDALSDFQRACAGRLDEPESGWSLRPF